MSNGQMPMINVGGGLPPEILQQQQALNRQQQMAQLLMQQGQSMPSGQMVSGRYVAPSFFQYAAPLFQTYAGTRLAEKGDKAAVELAQKLRDQQQKMGEQYFEALQGKPATYGADVPTETYETVKGSMISPATGPDYRRAFGIATDPYAPAWLKSQAAEMLKPKTVKEGETISQLNLATGKYEPMVMGGMSLPSDVKSAAVRVGLDPSKANTWGQNELNLINNRIVADKEAGRTNLVVNTGKAYTGAFGEGIAKEDLGYKKIAFSYGAEYYLNHSSHPNENIAKALGRIEVVSRMYTMGLINENDRVHLLGCQVPQEFSLYKDMLFIETIDTSNPIMATLDGIQYGRNGLTEKPKANMNDHFYTTDLDYNLLDWNLRMFRKLLK